MFIKLFLTITLSATVLAEKVRYDNYALYKLYPKNEEQLKYLKDLYKDNDGLDFWYPPTRVGDFASVVSPPENKDKFEHALSEQDIHYEVMQENIQEAFEAQLPSRSKRDTSRQLHWTAYQTQSQIIDWIYDLADKHDFVEVIHGGQSYEGRNITGVKISRGSGRRRAFFVEGGQVGADWLSPTVVTYLIDQLVKGEDPEAKAAAEEFDWYIFPITNPDGFEYSQMFERLWVKNRRPIAAWPVNNYGIDLTKNWNSQWGISGGSFNPADNNYIGLGPFSEIETRSLSRFVEGIPSLVGALSFRQFGQRLLLPFAHSSEALYNHDEMITIGRRAMGSLSVRYGTQYIVGTSRNVHDGATGNFADWVKHRKNPTIVATWQLRDQGAWGYILPVAQVLPSCEETFDSVMAVIREAKFVKAL